MIANHLKSPANDQSAYRPKQMMQKYPNNYTYNQLILSPSCSIMLNPQKDSEEEKHLTSLKHSQPSGVFKLSDTVYYVLSNNEKVATITPSTQSKANSPTNNSNNNDHIEPEGVASALSQPNQKNQSIYANTVETDIADKHRANSALNAELFKEHDDEFKKIASSLKKLTSRSEKTEVQNKAKSLTNNSNNNYESSYESAWEPSDERKETNHAIIDTDIPYESVRETMDKRKQTKQTNQAIDPEKIKMATGVGDFLSTFTFKYKNELYAKQTNQAIDTEKTKMVTAAGECLSSVDGQVATITPSTQSEYSQQLNAIMARSVGNSIKSNSIKSNFTNKNNKVDKTMTGHETDIADKRGTKSALNAEVFKKHDKKYETIANSLEKASSSPTANQGITASASTNASPKVTVTKQPGISHNNNKTTPPEEDAVEEGVSLNPLLTRVRDLTSRGRGRTSYVEQIMSSEGKRSEPIQEENKPRTDKLDRWKDFETQPKDKERIAQRRENSKLRAEIDKLKKEEKSFDDLNEKMSKLIQQATDDAEKKDFEVVAQAIIQQHNELKDTLKSKEDELKLKKVQAKDRPAKL